ncbi:hypothetical protein E0D86_06575 [Pseudomonas sp. IC_126]|uniref:hypothetical protein n=1 Tax=Pseudomonas sp. IC_126 TaxID=2547400 RepID=UPI00103D17AE|nr:hypothetical protein [Pseudomonas sp. IC_126]TCD22321.1 hypothetical protein E0D86_06575 [Pseudomonas sp. IC_126]
MWDTIIAALSLTLSLGLAVFYYRDRRQSRFAIEKDYINNLTAWHDQVIVLLIKSKHFHQSQDKEERTVALSSLSALIEQGRFLFPNIDKGDGFGEDKPIAKGIETLLWNI